MRWLAGWLAGQSSDKYDVTTQSSWPSYPGGIASTPSVSRKTVLAGFYMIFFFFFFKHV